MSVEGIYFDGTSSKGYPVRILLASGGLELILLAGDREIRHFWPIDEVRDKGEAHQFKTVLAHGDILPKYLEIDGRNFHETLKQRYPAWNPSRSVVAASSRLTIGAIFLIGLLVVGFFYLVVAQVLPYLAEQAAIRMPWSWEKSMGQGLKEQFLVDENIDPHKTALLNQFYQKLSPLPPRLPDDADRPETIQLTYVRNGQFNAFALPGRQIVVFDGALQEMESYPELVALIGHECGHVEGRHSLRSIFRSLSTYLAISIFLGDVGGLTAVLIENANTLRNLSYSRDFEREADKCSHEFLCLNRIDPHGTVQLMKAMQEISGDNETDPDFSFLSSHPVTAERIENAKNELKQKPCTPQVPDPELERLFMALKSKSK